MKEIQAKIKIQYHALEANGSPKSEFETDDDRSYFMRGIRYEPFKFTVRVRVGRY